MKKFILITLVFSLMIVGCGKSNRSSDSSSGTTIDPVVNPTNTALAYCNQASSSNTQMKVTVFTENNQIRNDLLRVKFSKMNSSFFSTGSVLQFYRWKAAADGTYSPDTTPLPVRVIDTTSNSEVLSSNYVRFADLSSSTQDMSKYILVVDIKDASAEYEVIRAMIYTSSGTIIEDINALIPAFSANPTEYATRYDGAARPTILKNLHPFRNYTGSGYTTSQFVSQANAFCF